MLNRFQLRYGAVMPITSSLLCRFHSFYSPSTIVCSRVTIAIPVAKLRKRRQQAGGEGLILCYTLVNADATDG